jgi:hypothetical protein
VDAILRYVFRWDTNEQNLKSAICNTIFFQKIKIAVLEGKAFYEVLGLIGE